MIKQHNDNPDRMKSLTRCIPDLFNHQSVLYVGAHSGRMDFGKNFQHVGCKITILEIFPKNVEFLKGKGFDVIQGDVREAHLIFDPQCFDVVFWWHGPEHLEEDEIQIALHALENVAKKLVVLGCPWGKSPQGAEYGNPYEIHASSLEPELFNSFGYNTETLRTRGFRSNITAWKYLSVDVKRTNKAKSVNQ